MTRPSDFIEAFEHAWRDPVTRFASLFHPDGTLFQQGMERPLTRGEIPDHVAAIRALLPDHRVEVERWAANHEDVFIEWTSTATFRGSEVCWGGASRFTLLDGLILEEVAYFDTLPLRAAIDLSTNTQDLLATADDATHRPRRA